jgi:osmotically-inducible protein OsmY
LLGLVLALLGACSPGPHRQGTGEYLDDALISSRVKAAFAADPEVKATEVKVDTYKGTVQLSGFVETDEARTRALQLARDVEGVKKVKDAMEVRHGS